MSARSIIETAKRAMPLMTPEARAEVETIVHELERTANAEESALHEARTAFEKDMQPVCGAIVGALQAGDLDALRGLRALLPHLLAEVNAEPALAEVLAQQLGKSLLTGLNAGPEDVL